MAGEGKKRKRQKGGKGQNGKGQNAKRQNTGRQGDKRRNASRKARLEVGNGRRKGAGSGKRGAGVVAGKRRRKERPAAPFDPGRAVIHTLSQGGRHDDAVV